VKLGIASPQRTMVDVRREPPRPIERTARQRLNDVRAVYHRKRLESLLQALASVKL
jgi:hypothetical protein